MRKHLGGNPGEMTAKDAYTVFTNNTDKNNLIGSTVNNDEEIYDNLIKISEKQQILNDIDKTITLFKFEFEDGRNFSVEPNKTLKFTEKTNNDQIPKGGKRKRKTQRRKSNKRKTYKRIGTRRR